MRYFAFTLMLTSVLAAEPQTQQPIPAPARGGSAQAQVLQLGDELLQLPARHWKVEPGTGIYDYRVDSRPSALNCHLSALPRSFRLKDVREHLQLEHERKTQGKAVTIQQWRLASGPAYGWQSAGRDHNRGTVCLRHRQRWIQCDYAARGKAFPKADLERLFSQLTPER